MEAATLMVIASILTLVWYWLNKRKKRRLPPGPIGLPIVGYLPFLSWELYLNFEKLAKKYGPVFSLKLGSRYVIVINDYPSMKAAFTQDAFMGRPRGFPFRHNDETDDSQAIIGLPWKEHKRFSMHMLRDLGFGTTRMEEHMKEEINQLLETLKNAKGEPMFTTPLLTASMSNNITSLVFGQKFKYDDPNRKMLDRIIRDGIPYAVGSGWQMFFPWIAAALRFFKIGSIEKLTQILTKFRNFLWKEIEKHEATLNHDNVRDFIDCFLLEMEKRKGDPTFNKKVLQDMVTMLFGAGSDTVRVTVEWLLVIVASYPDVQKRVQAEIDDVIGSQRFPTRVDHIQMPFTECVLMEQMRWRPTVPINIFKYTLADTTLNDYFIPKNSHVFTNFWAVHHNPEYWGRDTDVFRPERFLSEDKKTFIKSPYLMPFSIGKRSCPGESFAKVEVFLYFTAILQKFDVKLPAGKTINLKGEFGVGLMPKDPELCFIPREV